MPEHAEDSDYLSDIAEEALAKAGSMVDQGYSPSTISRLIGQARGDFINAARARGYTTDFATGLADSMGLLPTSVRD